MEATIENKVAKSGLVNIDLESFFPKEEVVEFDISPFLFHGLLLKEKEYRESLATFDWQQFEGKILAVYCSTDAILAPWAFMLVVQYASGFAKRTIKGNASTVQFHLLYENLINHEWSQYADKRVLIKGCGERGITDDYYAYATERLIQHGVSRLMYGEACSFVPVYRK